jgi:hypothetical protein
MPNYPLKGAKQDTIGVIRRAKKGIKLRWSYRFGLEELNV